jgi:hypothetical protein
MEMQRRTVHRGIVALAIVTSLSAAGPRPAAAMDLGFLDPLNHLWSLITGGDASRATRQARHASEQGPTAPPTKNGWGIDPNGHEIVNPYTPTQGLPSTNS